MVGQKAVDGGLRERLLIGREAVTGTGDEEKVALTPSGLAHAEHQAALIGRHARRDEASRATS
jgi:hypothetical protein